MDDKESNNNKHNKHQHKVTKLNGKTNGVMTNLEYKKGLRTMLFHQFLKCGLWIFKSAAWIGGTII